MDVTMMWAAAVQSAVAHAVGGGIRHENGPIRTSLPAVFASTGPSP
jgi:hypothetical protein